MGKHFRFHRGNEANKGISNRCTASDTQIRLILFFRGLASQARHELVSPGETIASRNVVWEPAGLAPSGELSAAI
jgi:hypothetical protein